MSMSVTVNTPKMTEGGFIHFCRRKGWQEPIVQHDGNLVTCINKNHVAGRETWVPRQWALWFFKKERRLSYDGDYPELAKACGLFFANADEVTQLGNLNRTLAFARGEERNRISEQISELTSRVRLSDELILCEGLADARAAGLVAEIVSEGDQLVLDVEISDSIEEVGLQEVVI